MTLTRPQQLEIYRRMQRLRQFEHAGIRLYQPGKIPGAYHASLGQEAAIVGGVRKAAAEGETAEVYAAIAVLEESP